MATFAKTFDVDISTGRPAASNEAYYHGETIEFRAVRGRSVVTNIEYASIYYQTNGMGDVWWRTDGLTFHPTNDVGAASYRFFMEGRDEVGRDWHANGLLRLLPSPGFTPNEITMPVARLDFATVEVANAPYYDKTETEAKIIELAPAPDFSTNNAALVETIEATAPAPGNYAAVSNAAMNAYTQYEDYDETRHYDPSEICSFKGRLYRCVSDHEKTPGAFNPQDWEPVDVIGDLIDGAGLLQVGSAIASDMAWTLLDEEGSQWGFEDIYAPATNALEIARAATATNAHQDTALESLSGSISTLSDTKASKADATLTERGFSEWTILRNGVDVTSQVIYAPSWDPSPYGFPEGAWEVNNSIISGDQDRSGGYVPGGESVLDLAWPALDAKDNPVEYTATRTALPGYRLGPADSSNPNRDKPLASEAEAAANRSAIAELTDTTSTLNDSISTLSNTTATLSANKADRSELAGYATPADVYRIVAGTNVILVITNYNSTVHAPSMKLQHLDPETGEYVTYWDEARGHGITLTNAMDYADGVAARLDAAKAPRAWSRTTSGLGADAPEGTTFISTPVTHISSGFEFEKKITAGGTVWTLCSTSLAAGSTTNGFFEISALDGTPVFSVEKTDSVLVGVNPSAIDVVDNACVISVPAVADTHPFARVATTLVQPTWYKEDSDGMPAGAPASVTWSGQSGAWVATVDFGATPQGFVFFEYLQEGGVKIVNSAVVDLSQGVHYGGATYMPTVSGNELKFIRQ